MLVLSIYSSQSNLKEDFRDLREMVVKSGWLKSDPWFYLFHFVHIIGLEVLAWCLLWYFGTQWYIVLAAILILATVQVNILSSTHT